MSDNVAITQGSGTTIAADNISSVLYQRTKMVWGADGTATDVSAANPLPTTRTPATLHVTATAASAAAITATLAAAGAGLFHYITSIDIELYSTAARTGSATPWLVTTTNLPGDPVWNFPTAGAIGTIDRLVMPLDSPLRSSVANTATTIVAPAATGGIWRLNISYFTAA